jgi:tetratricopeptide (TPR) repeat protein
MHQNIVKSTYRLGELIVELGLIKRSELDYVLSIAAETSMPVGRVLVMSKLINELDLSNVLHCQTLLKEGLITIELARKAVDYASRNSKDINEALYRSGWTTSVTDEVTKIGELLLQANFISEEQLEQGLVQQAKTRLPLGRILVLSGVLTESLLTTAVNAQILVRDKKLDKAQAIESLKHAKSRQTRMPEDVKEKGFYELPNRACPRLGEILTGSSVITDSQLLNALEVSLTEKKSLGQTLIDSKAVSRDLLEAALRIQQMISESKLSLVEAKPILKGVRNGLSFDEALSKRGSIQLNTPRTAMSLATLLKLFGCIDDAAIAQAFAIAQNNSKVLSQTLLIGGILDEIALEKAEQCRQLVEGRRLTVERAGIVFDYSQRRGIDIATALKELQWQHGDDTGSTPQLVVRKPHKYSKTEWIDLRESACREVAKGNFKSARDILKLLLAASTEDERHYDCLDAIAETYMLENDSHAAEEYFQKALEEKIKRCGKDDIVVAFAVNNLGKVAYFQKRYEEAERQSREFIRICAAALGGKHPRDCKIICVNGQGRTTH